MHRQLVAVSALGLTSLLSIASAADAPRGFSSAEDSLKEFRASVAGVLKQHCVACHGGKKAEGELDLEKLEPDMKTSTSAARWAVVLQKVVGREMPPEDKPQLNADELQALTHWIQSEMKRAGKHVARREQVANGNVIPHALLFDPKSAAPFENTARVRTLSPEIYDAFLKEVAKGAEGLATPFSPVGRGAFKDVGTSKIDEPSTAQLIQNALAIVTRHTNFKIEDGKPKAVGQMPKEFLQLLDEQNPPTEQQLAAAIKVQFDRVLKRQPTQEETARYVDLLKRNISAAGQVVGVRYSLAAVYLLPEAIFRWEVGTGESDAQGRVRLAPREIAYALAFAVADRRPESWLLTDADKGNLNSREGVEAAVRKLLDDPKSEKPRILRFFREYFGYAGADDVFKDPKDNPEHEARPLIEDTDRLVLYVVDRDQQVLKELLTTNKSFVAHKQAAELKKKRAEERAKFEANKAKEPEKYKNKKLNLPGRAIYESYNLSDFPDEQPVELPASQRAGILTQPAWLVAYSQSENNHAILRGKWLRERLLGGVVPDIPITVDAQLPIAPEKSLRERMEVTRQEYCWKCHQLMNPVGLPFEMFDHYGRYRTEELSKPVDASGRIDLTDFNALHGDVPNALDLIRKLAASEQVEQVFVRHCFRYWMGRNESLGDAATLQAAHAAYRSSNGSLKALLVSLLTSDAFLYRVPSTETATSTPRLRQRRMTNH